MSSCPFCQSPPSPETWWAWQEDPEGTLRREGGELRLHMENHRPAQPAKPGIWRARDYKRAADKLSSRQRRLLRIMRGGGALSIEQGASFLFGSAGTKEIAKTTQDLRILLRGQFVYRLFLEYLPGEGPRPSQPPALFFLGKSARIPLPEKLQKRREWFEEIDDFPTWREPYEIWRRNGRAALVARSSDIEVEELRTRGLRQSFSDPLLGKTTVNPESLLQVTIQKHPLSLFLFHDNHMRPAQTEVERLVRFGALLRSNTLSQPAIALAPARNAARGRELLRAGQKHTLPSSTLILLAPEEELQKEDPSWRSLVHGQSGRLEDFVGKMVSPGHNKI